MASQEPLPHSEPPKDRNRKRLIVLCDGTWQDSTSDNEKANPTNVTRFARALSKWVRIKKEDGTDEDVEQIVYYQQGVGTGTLDRLIGGVSGLGVSANVRAAYGFLANNYDPGDEIFFVGFSRGAYTARSIAGLVTSCGLLTKKGMDSFPILYNLYYKDYKKKGYAEKETAFLRRLHDDRLLEPAAALAVEAIAVWDTVEFHQTWISTTWMAKMLGIQRETIEFHDKELSPKVKYGFHALALDETRNPFKPTLWQMPKAPNGARFKELKQVWFSGKHSDVGGGYSQRWLSDITLAWMVAQCSQNNLLAFDQDYLLSLPLPSTPATDTPWGTAKGQTTSDKQGISWIIDKASRTLPLLSSYRAPLSQPDTNETIHCSIESRKFGQYPGSNNAKLYPCGVLTGSKGRDGWQLKSKADLYLPEATASKLEQTFKDQIRPPTNPSVLNFERHS